METDTGGMIDTKGSSSHHQTILCEQLWALRTEGLMCDAIINADSVPLHAHCLILSACSPVLKTRCANTASETQDGFILCMSVEGYSYKVCYKVLEFIYTGRTADPSEVPLEEFYGLCREWGLRKIPHVPPCEVDREGETEWPHDLQRLNCPTSSTLSPRIKETEPHMPIVESRNVINNLGPQESAFEGSMNKEPCELIGKRKLPQPRGRSKRKRTVLSSPNSVQHSDMTRECTDQGKTIENCTELDQSAPGHIAGRDDAYNASTSIDDSSEDETNICDTPKYSRTVTLKMKRPTKKIKKETKKRPRGRPRKSTSLSAEPVKLKEENESERLGSGKLLCGQCDLRFDKREALVNHRKEHYKENLNCSTCHLQFPDRNQLLAHNVERHFEEGMELPKIYFCVVSGCSFNTHKRMSFYNHRLHAHPSECSICDVCGKTLKNELTLRQHKAVVHPNSPRQVFACSTCDKIFKTESGMQKHKDVAHLPVSSEREKFVCPYCAHTCMLAESLTEHLYKKHDILPPSKKSYKCQFCDFKTTHISEIKKHEIRHKPDKEKPFHCGQCEKRFVDRGSLVSHQLKHDTGANIHRCQYCDYSTKYSHNLRGHVQVRHENKDYKPWECDECTYRCNSKGNLYKHLRNVHKRTIETKYTVNRDNIKQEITPTDNPVQLQPVVLNKNQIGVKVSPTHIEMDQSLQHVEGGRDPTKGSSDAVWTLQVDTQTDNDIQYSECSIQSLSQDMPFNGDIPVPKAGPPQYQHAQHREVPAKVQLTAPVCDEKTLPETMNLGELNMGRPVSISSGHLTDISQGIPQQVVTAHDIQQQEQRLQTPISQNMGINSVLFPYPDY